MYIYHKNRQEEILTVAFCECCFSQHFEKEKIQRMNLLNTIEEEKAIVNRDLH